jgi:hypothetical protein
MKSEIKCPNCGSWNDGTTADGKCRECSEPLRPVSENERESFAKRVNPGRVKMTIYPDDSFGTRLKKNLYNNVALVFFVVLTGVMFLLAVGPG